MHNFAPNMTKNILTVARRSLDGKSAVAKSHGDLRTGLDNRMVPRLRESCILTPSDRVRAQVDAT